MALRAWLREPLLHFLVLGAGLFLLSSRGAGDRDEAGRPGDAAGASIVVGTARVEGLAEGFARTWQRAPTPEELDGLIEDHIREEVLYREALALGLDRDDTIVRRRLRQKMEFLADDLAEQAEPTEDDLRAFLAKEPDRFRIEARLTFRHIYLNADRRGEAVEQDAERLLAEVSAAAAAGATIDAAALGDRFLLGHDFEALPEGEVSQLFGDRFAAAVRGLAPGKWHGPVESGYGRHLVIVVARAEGRVPALAEVRDAVRREWHAARRREANEALYRRLRERYTVTVERPAAP